MDVFQIRGGDPLHGKVKVSGSKNSAHPLFAAALLTEEEIILENVPDLSDVKFMGEILTELGAKVDLIDSNTWKIRASSIVHYAPYELVRKMRASICLLGPLVARLRKAEIQLKADEKFKHLGYAVQWVFFGLLSIGLAIMIRRKNINVKKS